MNNFFYLKHNIFGDYMIENLMNRNLIILDIETSLTEVAKAMKKHDVGMIVLKANNKIKGLITDRDIVTKIIANNDNKIKNYLTTNLISIDVNSEIKEALELMKKHKIKRLLVKNNNKLVGVLSLSDLFNASDSNSILETIKSIFTIDKNTDKYFTEIDEFEL